VVDVTIGIDPGVGGAVAALDGRGRLVALDDTPTIMVRSGRRQRRAYDVAAMRAAVSRCAAGGTAAHAVIEHQRAMPKQGVASMFSTGYGYGLWVGLLAGLGIPHTVVEPQRWQAAMLLGRGDPKARALLAASRLFPSIVIPRTRHGRADALLLAEYGRRLLSGIAREAAS